MRIGTIGILAATLATACDAPPESASKPADPLQQQLEEAVNVYARAVQSRDHGALKAMLSKEVLGRLGRFEGGMDRFVEKQRGAMLKTFTMMDSVKMADRFTVTGLNLQADTAAVTLTYAGQEVPRPFYFVKEDGRWALNVARPGFSQALPEGALPMNTYRVTTQSWGSNANFRDIGCVQSNGGWFF